MATGFKRETMIALRARRSAYRIACDFLYPHVEVPPPAEPTPFAMEADWTEGRGEPSVPRSPPQPKLIALAIVLWVIALTVATVVITHNWKFP